ncbi:MAG: GDP-L-fucose synthase [Parasphingorhabdus sp.]
MVQKKRIFVAGHRGMVGQAIVRRLLQDKTVDILTRDRSELDLTEQQKVREFLAAENPDQIYIAAAKVGGIHANATYPAEFIYKNLLLEANLIHGAWVNGIKKLLFLGSSCIYPKLAPQPMPENSLLTGQLESTNEPYAIAKIAGIKLCESYNRQYSQTHGTDFRSVMPTNLYGPGDNYHPENSHVIPALIRRFFDAKMADSPSVTIWGSGKPRREFLHADDAADACVHIMSIDRDAYAAATEPMMSHVNVGTGHDTTIGELAQKISDCVGYTGEITFDPSKPDGPMRKQLDVSLINKLGWSANIDFDDGLRDAVQGYQELVNDVASFNEGAQRGRN